MIRAMDLTKVYGNKKVVNSISFDINPGDYVAIVGPSGSGKTTLLSIISGLITPNKGDIYFEKIRLNSLSASKKAAFRAKHIGLIFQFSELIPSLNVFENIMMPALFAAKLSLTDYRFRAYELMDKLGIRNLEKLHPMELSGGQIQLVAIARSLINEPEFLLADEPSGDLDPEYSKRIKALFSDFNKKGLSILLVTHDMKLAFDAKTIYKMENGIFSDLLNKGRKKK